MIINSKTYNANPLNVPADVEIWSLFKSGNEEAYSELYKRYFFILFKYGKKITVNRELVKDCIQDLFVELWRTRENLGNPVSVRNYLFKSLRNKIIRKMSDKIIPLLNYKQTEEYEDEFVSSHEFNLINDQIFNEKNNSLREALNSLSKRQKEAVFLIFFNNITYAEASEIMCISVDSVYNLISNAIKVLQKNIRKVSISLLLLLSMSA